MREHFWMDTIGPITGAISPICSTIKVFKATKIGGLFAALIRRRPVIKSNLTFGQALAAGFNLNLEALGLPQLTPDQGKVLGRVLDEAIAKQQRPGLAGLLGRAVEQIRGRQRDWSLIEAIKAYVGLINEKMEAESVPRLTEDQSDSLGGMIYALID